jgi:hypothetical protein
MRLFFEVAVELHTSRNVHRLASKFERGRIAGRTSSEEEAMGPPSEPLEPPTEGEASSKSSAVLSVLDDMLGSFTSLYLTLVSIIQGGVFSFAVVIVYQNYTTLEASQWILVTVTGLFYVAVWQEYVYMSVLFSWFPGVKDAIFPFALGAAEFVLVSSILRGIGPWLTAMAGTLIIGILILANTNWRIHRDRNLNKTQWEILRDFPSWHGPAGALGFACFELLCACLLIFFQGFLSGSAGGRTTLAAVALAAVMIYYVRLVLYVPNFRRLREMSEELGGSRPPA